MELDPCATALEGYEASAGPTLEAGLDDDFDSSGQDTASPISGLASAVAAVPSFRGGLFQAGFFGPTDAVLLAF
ncbi:hypothetical protein SAY86_006854 [Trapa natans]|uniref:Uncharacterized protein n=1 Tax=Trapa natans TaxID=22666 RepID=A0AAN7QWJ4_TRANT|nr:hypothetical protein SAY86_006854 [Trapa natans]